MVGYQKCGSPKKMKASKRCFIIYHRKSTEIASLKKEKEKQQQSSVYTRPFLTVGLDRAVKKEGKEKN